MQDQTLWAAAVHTDWLEKPLRKWRLKRSLQAGESMAAWGQGAKCQDPGVGVGGWSQVRGDWGWGSREASASEDEDRGTGCLG